MSRRHLVGVEAVPPSAPLAFLLGYIAAMAVLSCCGCAEYQRDVVPGVITATWTDVTDPTPILCATVSTMGARKDFCGYEGSQAATLHDLGVGNHVQVVTLKTPAGTPYIESVRYGRGEL